MLACPAAVLGQSDVGHDCFLALGHPSAQRGRATGLAGRLGGSARPLIAQSQQAGGQRLASDNIGRARSLARLILSRRLPLRRLISVDPAERHLGTGQRVNVIMLSGPGRGARESCSVAPRSPRSSAIKAHSKSAWPRSSALTIVALMSLGAGADIRRLRQLAAKPQYVAQRKERKCEVAARADRPVERHRATEIVDRGVPCSFVGLSHGQSGESPCLSPGIAGLLSNLQHSTRCGFCAVAISFSPQHMAMSASADATPLSSPMLWESASDLV